MVSDRMELASPYSNAYSRYVLALLLLVTAFNVVDRSIVALVAQDIRTEMDLSDRQMGLLLGFAFTVVHLLAGLPIARLADRGGVRRTIIARCRSTSSGSGSAPTWSAIGVRDSRRTTARTRFARRSP